LANPIRRGFHVFVLSRLAIAGLPRKFPSVDCTRAVYVLSFLVALKSLSPIGESLPPDKLCRRSEVSLGVDVVAEGSRLRLFSFWLDVMAAVAVSFPVGPCVGAAVSQE